MITAEVIVIGERKNQEFFFLNANAAAPASASTAAGTAALGTPVFGFVVAPEDVDPEVVAEVVAVVDLDVAAVVSASGFIPNSSGFV